MISVPSYGALGRLVLLEYQGNYWCRRANPAAETRDDRDRWAEQNNRAVRPVLVRYAQHVKPRALLIGTWKGVPLWLW